MNLAKIQLLSLLTKAVTTALGIVQSVIIVRVLSPAEFGLVGLVMSIGSVIGVSQHLGIVDGAIREIAVRKDKSEIGKVFWVSHLARQTVTIPLSIALMLLAEPIAVGIYGRPAIVPYILIFAASLILQGLQDVLGATLTGMKKFVPLYVVQIVTAAINIAVFGYLTWRFSITGFFWAVIITTTIMVVMLAQIAWRNLRGHLHWPTWEDIKKFGRNIMRIGVYMYISRIFFVVWQRLPLLFLGGILTAEELGYINVSLTFGSKLTIIAMALSEVNLSWMSSLYVNNQEAFKKSVTRNLHRVLVLMLLMTLVMLYFTPEILRYIIGEQYLPAEHLIYLMTLAFFLYALVDIGTSSLFVPANNPKIRAVIYGCMTTISALLVGWLLLAAPDAFRATVAIVAGSVGAYILLVAYARTYGVRILSRQLALLLLALIGSVGWLFTDPSLAGRITAFLLLSAYALWEAHRSKLLPTSEVRKLLWQPTKESAPGRPNAVRIICFAGAEYDQPFWTNRQHMMSRISRQYPVLYIEPRVWLLRYFVKNWRQPGRVLKYIGRLFWYEKKHDELYVKSQWNLVPGSRESKIIAGFNHALNQWCVLVTARWLGFITNYSLSANKGPATPRLTGKERTGPTGGQPITSVVWLYDTEAAEYLSALERAIVVYDCVDDHAAQAGVDRNPQRVKEEEAAILSRADLVTVTSRRLLALKQKLNANTHLVLNAGDVALFTNVSRNQPYLGFKKHGSIFGTVGALDEYKVDFALLEAVATKEPNWDFVFIGAPVVRDRGKQLTNLARLENVHMLGIIDRERVPAYVQQFDVCMIPYKDNAYNTASFPLKFWEFMASGKPIIVSGVPELKEYRNLIEYVRSPEEFIRAANRLLQHSGSEAGRAARRSLAADHTWDQRARRLLDLLRNTIHNKETST